ncbi:MAG: nucleotidyl transferase AbiEii/AbiGii toxin family protein [Candidatus Marinimicrobia bacterium]|nr:nucleotidyl transferase AbiEii/AbiGii toxin family protein [Candidatus Neomarinimicrobiota bacterium]
MSGYAKYYEEKLYPIQDGVLSIINKLDTPFFLTGGTALSRYYFTHRYSDDLDLFVHNDPQYLSHVETVLNQLIKDGKGRFDVEMKSIKRNQNYTQLYVIDTENPDVELRIDLINDIAAHFGEIEMDAKLGKVDNWRNILSNKLTALFRSEPKDVVDIQAIARHRNFNWKSIVNEAKMKEAGVEPEILHDMLMSFPVSYIDTIKWIEKPDEKRFSENIKMVADDILFGRSNSIYIPK